MPWQIWRCSDISIHALREEGDVAKFDDESGEY